MSSTSKGYPFPAATDPDNVPGDIQALATKVDSQPGIASMTTTARDALAGGDLWAGRVIFNITMGQLEENPTGLAGAWRSVRDKAPDVQTFTASGTWTKPAGAVAVLTECWGGGGGGAAFCGGGGGGCTRTLHDASTLPATAAVTVGAGGAGTITGGAGTGGTSIIDFGGGLFDQGRGGGGGYGGAGSLYAGGGGGAGATAGDPGNSGGAGYGGNPAGGFPSAPLPGGASIIGGGGGGGIDSSGRLTGGSSIYGGGGGGAGNVTSGTNGSAGGSSVYGGGGGAGSGPTIGTNSPPGASVYGGAGGSSGTPGQNGHAPGGGGGAGINGGGGGGAGGAGMVRVTTYFAPVVQVGI